MADWTAATLRRFGFAVKLLYSGIGWIFMVSYQIQNRAGILCGWSNSQPMRRLAIQESHSLLSTLVSFQVYLPRERRSPHRQPNYPVRLIFSAIHVFSY